MNSAPFELNAGGMDLFCFILCIPAWIRTVAATYAHEAPSAAPNACAVENDEEYTMYGSDKTSVFSAQTLILRCVSADAFISRAAISAAV